ncbi:MAG: GxxExxY protein, partial [Planctomycetia bacterium]|nr:GxxExxY protein [Planctomycetia bacterium]
MKIKTNLSERMERIGKIIVNCAYRVHKNIGPGLLESVYEKCLVYELIKAGLKVKTQVDIPFLYDGKNMDLKLRIDILVENSVIIELKAVEEMHPVFQAQLISYLKLTGNRLGFLINFNVPLIKDG